MPVTKVYEARYIDPEQLRSMLIRLFPGKWAAEVCEPADCRGVLADAFCLAGSPRAMDDHDATGSDQGQPKIVPSLSNSSFD